MAKKAVAKLSTGTGRSFTKCIIVDKSETGSYTFKTEMVHMDLLDDYIKEKKAQQAK